MGVTKHGHCTNGITPTYHSWASMVSRCTDTNKSSYGRYGGRGITVCEQWLDFKGFLVDMGEKPTKLMLERIDNNKGYYKENCKWATRKEQNRNKRNVIWLTFNGKTLCASDWAREMGIDRRVIIRRFKTGWSVGETLTVKPIVGRNQYEV